MKLPLLALLFFVTTQITVHCQEGTYRLGRAEYALAPSGASLPDSVATPGAIATGDAAVVCVPGYSKQARKSVNKATLHAASAAYAVPWAPKQYEIDHLISIELGGAPADSKNLWPQPREKFLLPHGTPGAESKDKLENELHRLVCAGEISLGEAQTEISADWTISYQARLGTLKRQRVTK